MKKALFRRLTFQAFFLMAFSVLTGCSLFSHSVPTHYSLAFNSHPQTNNAAPLKVRVLLLRSDADFMSADFYSLQNSTASLLGSSLLNSEQFFLMPAQSNKTLSLPIAPDARYIGILAEYQSLDGKKWRLSLPLPAVNKNGPWQASSDELKVSINADASGLRVIRAAQP